MRFAQFAVPLVLVLATGCSFCPPCLVAIAPAPGSIIVDLTDARTGCAISGATLTLTDDDVIEIMEEVSGCPGQYIFTSEGPGTFRLDILASGFQDKTITGIEVTQDADGGLSVEPLSLDLDPI